VQNQAKRASDDAERTALLDDVDTDTVFRKALDAELDKVSKFYATKERELLNDVQQLLRDVEEYDDGDFEPNHEGWQKNNAGGGSSFSRWQNQRELGGDGDGDGDGSDDSDEEASGAGGRLLSRRPSRHMMHSITSDAPSDHTGGVRRRYSLANSEDGEHTMNMFYDKRITLKKRAISLFVALRELKSYSQLNKTGFTKALKKYDKILQRNLKTQYVEQAVAPAYCFKMSTIQHLDDNVSKVEAMYANLVTQGDLEEANKELRLHLREHVVWERNTVWRDMIGIERKTQAAHLGFSGPLLGDQVEKKRLAGDEVRGSGTKKLKTPFGGLTVPIWLFSAGFFTLTAIIIVFAILLQVKTFNTPEQQNCFAMLVFVSLLWATEVYLLQNCSPSRVLIMHRRRSFLCS